MTPYISHVEWLVSCLDRSTAFFHALFGWQFAVYSTHYRLYQPKQGVAVGLLETEVRRPGDSPMVHVHVADLDAVLQQAQTLGAKIVAQRTAVPGHGWYAQFEDYDGNRIGLFERDDDSRLKD